MIVSVFLIVSNAHAIDTASVAKALADEIDLIQGNWVKFDINPQLRYILDSGHSSYDCQFSDLCKNSILLDTKTLQIAQWWTNWSKYTVTADVYVFENKDSPYITGIKNRGTLECEMKFSEDNSLDGIRSPGEIQVVVVLNECVIHANGTTYTAPTPFRDRYGRKHFSELGVSVKSNITTSHAEKEEVEVQKSLVEKVIDSTTLK